MNYVMPIRDKEKIKQMKQALRKRSERDYMIFMIGINTGLRISDILPLRVRDVKGAKMRVLEQKTNKIRSISINEKLRIALDKYTKGMKDNDYLIESRNKDEDGNSKPIHRNRAYEILRGAAEEVGINGIGTHSMRKTFGYHLYQRTKDIEAVRKILRHSNVNYTRSYIGIEDDYIDDLYMKQTGL